MKKFSSDYTRIPVIYGDLIQTPVVYPSSRLSQDYTRVAAQGDQPPDLGMVSEKVRGMLTKEYGIYPPNLSTAIQNDQSIIITAVSPVTGLNLQLTLKNLAADLITPNSRMNGVVPIEGQGNPPAPGGAPPGGMGPGMAPPPGGPGGAPGTPGAPPGV